MKIKLIISLVLKNKTRKIHRILEKTWDTLMDEECPFWTPGQTMKNLNRSLGWFGILNYPHTGDTHEFIPFKDASFSIKIYATSVNTSGITICSDLIGFFDEEGNPVTSSKDEILRTLIGNGWEAH